jgi:hypothetical protein
MFSISPKNGLVVHIRSRLVDRTKEIWTPKLRWFEEQSRQRYIPKGTDVQVGFFCPQSKHIYHSDPRQQL